MLIKFFLRGLGAGSGPVDYVTRQEGRENAPPDVLRGNPEETRDLIDSIDRDWRYTSGVVSFAVEDAPTPEQQERVMDDFEKTAFAGLEQDQYNILWVRHQHTQDGRIELHFVTPRMELTTGKALNIAPPNWQKHFDPLQTALNYENGWADPHSLECAKNTQRSPESEIRVKDRVNIGKYIETLVEANLVENRDDIINAIEETGLEVHRRGKDYISVKDLQPPENKPFRLKGKLYEQGWTVEQYQRPLSREQEADRGVDRERAASARRELAERIERRAHFHEQRYNRSNRRHNAKLEAHLEADNLDYSRLRPDHDRVLDHSLGRERLEVERIKPDQAPSLDSAADSHGIGGQDGRNRDLQGGKWIHSSPAGEGKSEELPVRNEPNLHQDHGVDHGQQQSFTAGTRVNAIRQCVGQWLSRGYDKITGWIEALTDGASSANNSPRIAERSLSSATRRLSDTGKELKRTLEIDINQIAPRIRRGIEDMERDKSRSRGIEI